jgi:phosphodiesterase/alkaline phosphatase D-like protein
VSRRVKEDWWADADVDRAQIFVPAIMGAGILVSMFTLFRDALHGRRRHGRARQTALHARAAAHFVRTAEPPDSALRAGLRPRVHYVLLALSAGALAAYGARGATKNYAQAEGLFGGGVAWMYATLLVAAAGLVAVAATSAVTAVTWPSPPRWQRPLLARTPLGEEPVDPSDRRHLGVVLLGWAAVLTGAGAAQFVFTVSGAPQLLAEFDDEVGAAGAASGVPWEWLGTAPVAVGLAVVVGLVSLRCPTFALGQLAVVVGALVAHGLFTEFAPRAHPPDGPLAGLTDSLPSASVLQATLFAGFLSLAVFVRTRRRTWALLTLAVTAAGVLVIAVLAVRDRLHWPSDVGAAVLAGLALVLATWWAMERADRHRRCVGCPWEPADGTHAAPGLLPVTPAQERKARRNSRLGLAAVLVLFVVLALVEGLPTSPDGETMGPGFARTLQLALLGLVVLALLVALRWEAVGAALAALAGTLLAVFAAITYRPWVSLLVAVLFLAPAVGFWLVWQHRRTLRSVTVLALATALVLSLAYGASAVVYDRFYGPAHPLSGSVALPVEGVVWAWAGAVTGRSAQVVAELAPGAREARLVVRDGDDRREIRSAVVAASPAGTVRLAVDGLTPDTAYAYTVEVDGTADRTRGAGVFSTMPEGPASFTLAVGACARTGSSGAVFDAIRDVDPLLYLQLGDLHYGNIARDDVVAFGDRYRDVLTAPSQAALYRSVPVAYVWGDHDFGGNDADSTSPSRTAAREAYRAYVPHHELAEGDGGSVYHAFTVGRVRVVMTDTRSERTATSMLGERQLAWLEDELVTASREHALVIWANPDPWVAPDEPGRDDWGGYAAERQRIADVLAGASVDNLVMVSADAHMLAIDDGTNTDYSSAGGAGFPLLHAAALDRPGSFKGGPYSEGAFPGPGHFGTVTVEDDGGDTVDVELAGRNWRGEVVVSLRTTVPA